MAFPIVQSSTQVANSLTIPAPSGIQVGDLLLVFCGYFETGGSRTMGTISDFTILHRTGNSSEGVGCFHKRAVAADTTASDYTLGFSGAVEYLGMSMHRISDAGDITGIRASDFKVNADRTGTATSPVYASSMTPLTNDSLAVVMFMGASTNIGSVQTLSGYAITPSATLTERADVGEQSGGGSGSGVTIGVATGNYSGLAPITSRTATFSTSQMTRDQNSIAVLINGTQNAAPDVSHLNIAPTLLGLVGANNVVADVPHLAIVPTVTGVNTRVNNPVWTDQIKTPTTWTPEIK